MKPLSLLIALLLGISFSFAQTPQTIEAGLLKSFNRIGYWDSKLNDGSVAGEDSLDKANVAFGQNLKSVAEKYPATISMPFPLLKKASVYIVTSADGMFRIYSWDTGGGGTMREFANVMQFKVGANTHAMYLYDTDFSENSVAVPYYSNLYTFKTGSKTYYFGIYGIVESSRYAGTGIKVFAIENGKLNDDARLIKTGSGLRSKIFYEYDFGSVTDIPFGKRPTITFDTATQTIKIPVVTGKGTVTKNFITYKFNGQYFEKVKS